MVYNCIVIEDDEVERLGIVSRARRHPFINIIGTYSSADEALRLLPAGEIHIALSDIDLPGISGIDFRRKMMDIPVCIFITSYPDYAVESFELSALDFLVKPVKPERFNTALLRAKNYLEVRQKANLYDYSLGGDIVYVKQGHDFVKINLHDILYLEALKDYTSIVTDDKKFCVRTPISSLLKENSFMSFVRVHRSYAVQKNLIGSITPSEVFIGNTPIPIGRSYKDALAQLKS